MTERKALMFIAIVWIVSGIIGVHEMLGRNTTMKPDTITLAFGVLLYAILTKKEQK